MSRKSFQLYFNMENENERLMYEYLQGKNKNSEIKRLIMNEMKNLKYVVDSSNISNNNNNNNLDDFDDNLWNE